MQEYNMKEKIDQFISQRINQKIKSLRKKNCKVVIFFKGFEKEIIKKMFYQNII